MSGPGPFVIVRRGPDGALYLSGRVPGVANAWGTRMHAASYPAEVAGQVAADVGGELEPAGLLCVSCDRPVGPDAVGCLCYRCAKHPAAGTDPIAGEPRPVVPGRFWAGRRPGGER